MTGVQTCALPIFFNTREPWSYNPRAERVIGDFMRLRHQLFPYVYTMNARCAKTQIPLMLPLYHVSPEEKAAYEAPNAYWFGSEMIAAPITEPMDESALAASQVYLPEGIWTDLFTGRIYRGNQTLTVCRALEQMPIFLKSGAIVPMQAHEPGEKKLGGAAHMELYIAPGADNAFALYEDDGESLAFQNGAYALTEIALAWGEKQAQLTIAAAKDAADVVPKERRWDVHFVGYHKDCRFVAEGETLASRYDAKRHMHTVTITGDTAKAMRIAVSCEVGLVQDDADAYDACIDILLRAQIPMAAKVKLHEQLDRVAERMKQGLPVKKSYLGCDQYKTLGLALYEIMMGTKKNLA